MNQAEQLAERIREVLPDVKKGTLRFWGLWFGRPHENWHTLVRCDAEQDLLRLYFDNGEILSVWFPGRLTVKKSKFRISKANRVRWEWFSYGQPKTPSNLCFMDFVRSAKGIVVKTNFTTGKPGDGHTPELKASRWEAAVEIL